MPISAMRRPLMPRASGRINPISTRFRHQFKLAMSTKNTVKAVRARMSRKPEHGTPTFSGKPLFIMIVVEFTYSCSNPVIAKIFVATSVE